MSDSTLISLYSGAILDLAANIPLTGRLEAPEGSAKRRSPLCGSSLTVDLVMDQGRISAFAQDVRACALGQASAAILGGAVLGCSAEQILRARDQLKAMLSENGPAPDAPFEAYHLLAAAREFPNRHASILLALEASCEALRAAGALPPAA